MAETSTPDAPFALPKSVRDYVPTAMWVAIALAFPAIGLFTGWLVGASNSPVVATLLPLAFGIFGALSYGMLEHRVLAHRTAESLASLDQPMRERVLELLAVPQDRSMKMPAFWAVGVVAFCITCFVGVRSGLEFRTDYPSLEDLLGITRVQVSNSDAVDTEPSPQELVLLHSLRLRLHASNVPKRDASALFRDVINPILRARRDHERYNTLALAVSQLQFRLDGESQGGANYVFPPGGLPHGMPEP